MKFKCEGCKTIWLEKQVFRVEQYSKSAFCRACSSKCHPMIEEEELKKFFNFEDDTDTEIPAEVEKEEKEPEIEFSFKKANTPTKREDDPPPWEF